MIFGDYSQHPHQTISPSILWEYNLQSPSWDWNKMAARVVERVLMYGRENDYYAMLQLYGGFDKIAEIVKTIPELPAREAHWACFLFGVKQEDMLCYTRKSLRQKHLNS